MKKLFFFFAALIAFFEAHSKTYVLSRSGKLGAGFVDTLEIQTKNKEELYILNGVSIEKTRKPLAVEYRSRLSQLKNESNTDCGAGKYVVLIQDGKNKKEISGCPYGKDYGKLIGLLYNLKK